MDLHGICPDEYRPVAEAFMQNFADGLETGAAIAITVDGQVVVDLWAGDADGHGRPWEHDTLVNVYSSTKTVAALCMLMLADRELLDFDAPVAHYWPEFAHHGKDRVLVRHVMAHTAGLPGFDPAPDTDTICDVDARAAQLADQELWLKPGETPAYHLMTQGYLQAEIFRRITGQAMADWLHDNVTGPLGADFHMTLPESEDHRVADLIVTAPPRSPDDNVFRAYGKEFSWDSLTAKAVMSGGLDPTHRARLTRRWRTAGIPSASGIGTARGLAQVHSVMACHGTVDGTSYLSPETVQLATIEQSAGVDQVLGDHVRYGMGFGIERKSRFTLPNPHTLFWTGWGGSLALIDLDAKTSIAYVTNQMHGDPGPDNRSTRIVDAFYAASARLH